MSYFNQVPNTVRLSHNGGVYLYDELSCPALESLCRERGINCSQKGIIRNMSPNYVEFVQKWKDTMIAALTDKDNTQIISSHLEVVRMGDDGPDADAEGELHPSLLLEFDELVTAINHQAGYKLILESDLHKIKSQRVDVERFKDMILNDDPQLYSSFKLPVTTTRALYEYLSKDMHEGKEDLNGSQQDDIMRYINAPNEEGQSSPEPFIGLLPNVPIVTNENEIAYNAEIANQSRLKPLANEFVPSQAILPPIQVPINGIYNINPQSMIQNAYFPVAPAIVPMYFQPMQPCNYIPNQWVEPVAIQRNMNINEPAARKKEIESKLNVDLENELNEISGRLSVYERDIKRRGFSCLREALALSLEQEAKREANVELDEALSLEQEAKREANVKLEEALALSLEQEANVERELRDWSFALEREAKRNANVERDGSLALERGAKRRKALRIKISNLAPSVRKETLSTLFCPYGDIKQVQIAIERSSANKDAIVIYKTKESAHRAQRALDGFGVSGQKIRVSICY